MGPAPLGGAHGTTRMGNFGVQRWRPAALCWLHGRIFSAQHVTIRQGLVLVLAPIATQCRRGNTNSEIKPGYHRKAVMHRQPGHEALRVSAVLWSCVVCLCGTWERRGSAGAELALCRQTPGGAVRARQKGSHSLSLFVYLFLFYYIFVSYSLSAATPFLLLTRCFCAGI